MLIRIQCSIVDIEFLDVLVYVVSGSLVDEVSTSQRFRIPCWEANERRGTTGEGKGVELGSIMWLFMCRLTKGE